MSNRRTVGEGADAALDGLLVVLAIWTVIYHLSLLLSIGSDLALAGTAVVLAGLTGWFRLRRQRSTVAEERPEPDPPCAPRARGRSWTRCTVLLALVASLAMALSLAWWLVVVGWIGAAVTGLLAALAPSYGPASLRRSPSTWEAPVVVAWALGLAVLAACIRRANPDDLYYVNLSQWVASHGTFPLRDTLFGDLRWPMTSWPPVASYDALTGAVAHVVGIRAGTVVYEIVPPLATLAAVLALWRLLRAWRAPHVAWAVSAALVFLLLDGTSSYASPGNLFVTRLWQGKVILLCVVVPLSLVHCLRYVDRPDRRGLGWLAVTGTAAVACSTTAMFLLPAIALAGVAPLARRPRAATAGFLALAGYPLVCGIVTFALGGRSADDFGDRELYRFDPEWIGHAVFLTGAVALVGVLAVLCGPLTVPHPAARVTAAVMLLIVGAVLVPGATQVAFRLTGLGPTLWRLTWGCTIGALVGMGAVRGFLLLRGRLPLALSVVVAVVCCAGYGLTAPSSLAPATHTSFAAPPHWQRSDGSRAVVAWILDALPPGGVVLAPNAVSITVSITSTRVRPVAPRDYFMDRLKGEPGFAYQQRLLLVHLANRTTTSTAEPNMAPSQAAVARALDRVGVDAACLPEDDTAAIALIRGSGFRSAYGGHGYQCLLREAE